MGSSSSPSADAFDFLFDLPAGLVCMIAPDGAILRLTPAWESALGCSRNILIGAPFLDFVHPDDRPLTAAGIAKLRAGAPAVSFENRCRCADGSHKWLLWTAGPAAGEPHVIAFAHDVTARKQAELQLRDYAASLEETRREQDEVARRMTHLMGELDEARSASERHARAKDDFLARMSHEIRTPMTAIMGMTELALGTPLSMEQREYLETVEESSQALLHIVNDILDFSKTEMHQIRLEEIKFSLRETVEATVKTMAVRASEKHLELSCGIERGVPDALIGDPARLRQIVLNLVGNAIKFTSRGEVSLVVKIEKAEETAALLHFAVSDTGIGVPEELRGRIFDSFAQADTFITRRYGGSGLGLTIAAKLAAMMGGRTWVGSNGGQGSIFHFTARFRLPESGAGRRPSPMPAALRGLPALVVDDNSASRHILRAILQNWKWKASGAASGREALDQAINAARAHRPFRLLLIGADMPEMNGLELAQRIRRLPPYRRAPIILLTVARNPADPNRIRRLQIAACLTKPVRQAKLGEAILASLHGGASRVAPRSPRARARRALAPLSILVAEDNPANQKLILLLLEKAGHRAVRAENGEEAVTAAQRRNVDLALMDLGMPIMSGLEATRAIRESEAGGAFHLPIIAMSAHATAADKERCLAAGMDAYLSKPIQAEALYQTIEQLAPSRRRRGRAAAKPGSRRKAESRRQLGV